MSTVPIVLALGIKVVSISKEGVVRLTMDISDKLNAVGGGHGGAVFSLADQAFAIASNLGPEVQVALSANISYLKPGKGLLEAVAIKISETRRTSLYEVKVYEGEELIAVFQGTGYKLNGNGCSAKGEAPAGK